MNDRNDGCFGAFGLWQKTTKATSRDLGVRRGDRSRMKIYGWIVRGTAKAVMATNQHHYLRTREKGLVAQENIDSIGSPLATPHPRQSMATEYEATTHRTGLHSYVLNVAKVREKLPIALTGLHQLSRYSMSEEKF